MYKHFLILLLFTCLKVCSQKSEKIECNTLFVCIDSISYELLFKNSFVKDTLFVCKAQSTQTNDDNYTGKYAIGQSATLEFFKPSLENKLGNHFGDWGIEFKTAQIGRQDYLVKKAIQQNLAFDTATTLLEEDTIVPWYKTFQLTTPYKSHQLSVIEYQAAYLQLLGFKQEEIVSPMAYKQFNERLSGGKKYPKQFNKIKTVTVSVNPKEAAINNTFISLIQDKVKKGNPFTLFQNIIAKEPLFSLEQVEIELLTEHHSRTIHVSENISIKIAGKKAFIIFNYTQNNNNEEKKFK